jgi:hypothetical protein
MSCRPTTPGTPHGVGPRTQPTHDKTDVLGRLKWMRFTKAEHAGRVRCSAWFALRLQFSLQGPFSEVAVLSGPTLLKEPPRTLRTLDQRAIDANNYDLLRDSRLL